MNTAITSTPIATAVNQQKNLHKPAAVQFGYIYPMIKVLKYKLSGSSKKAANSGQGNNPTKSKKLGGFALLLAALGGGGLYYSHQNDSRQIADSFETASRIVEFAQEANELEDGRVQEELNTQEIEAYEWSGVADLDNAKPGLAYLSAMMRLAFDASDVYQTEVHGRTGLATDIDELSLKYRDTEVQSIPVVAEIPEVDGLITVPGFVNPFGGDVHVVAQESSREEVIGYKDITVPVDRDLVASSMSIFWQHIETKDQNRLIALSDEFLKDYEAGNIDIQAHFNEVATIIEKYYQHADTDLAPLLEPDPRSGETVLTKFESAYGQAQRIEFFSKIALISGVLLLAYHHRDKASKAAKSATTATINLASNIKQAASSSSENNKETEKTSKTTKVDITESTQSDTDLIGGQLDGEITEEERKQFDELVNGLNDQFNEQ